jgi:drug/metabolite transporter (DMT)-like permease
VVILLSLCAALMFASSDFLGGWATRDGELSSVVVWSQLAGAVVLALALPLFAGTGPSTATIAWGLAAGIAGGTGVTLFYAGVAMGQMSLVSPLTALCAAAVPVLAGLALGDRPSHLAVVGLILALVSIVALSTTHTGRYDNQPRGRAIVVALGSGIAVGAFLVLLQRAGDDAGAWPLVGARIGSLSWVTAVSFALRRPPRRPRHGGRRIAVTGAFDMLANLAYLAAVQRGELSLVAVVSSLYPAGTVLLARTFFRERIGGAHLIGLLGAGVAVVLIAVG